MFQQPYFHKLLFCIALSLLVACSNQKKQTNQKDENSIDQALNEGLIDFDSTFYQAEDIVFYNLFSPVDLTYLISKKAAYYNSMLINPLSNITKYNQSTRAAINLGIYGADLSYLWMFEQSQQSLSYLAAVQRLSDQMEIPREFVDFTYSMAESHSHHQDTLIDLARKAYLDAEVYLKKNNRAEYADLVLLGGWIETMHIATQMYSKPDERLAAKIAAQKFSLNSIYKLMQNHSNNIAFAEYMLYLKKLKKIYDSANIVFPPDSLVVDTVHRRIMVKDETIIVISPEKLTEIANAVALIRSKLIN